MCDFLCAWLRLLFTFMSIRVENMVCVRLNSHSLNQFDQIVNTNGVVIYQHESRHAWAHLYTMINSQVSFFPKEMSLMTNLGRYST